MMPTRQFFDIAGVLVALLLPGRASADPIVYAVQSVFAMSKAGVYDVGLDLCVDDAGGLRTVPTGTACPVLTLRGTITTDGTLGWWEISEHLVSMELTLSDGTHSAQLDAYQGYLYSEEGLLAACAAHGPCNTIFGDPASGPSWIASCIERGSVYGCATAFGLEIHRRWIDDPFAPLGVPVPEPSTALLVGCGLLALGRVRQRATIGAGSAHTHYPPPQPGAEAR